MGLKVHYDPQAPQNIYDVGGNNILMVGFVVIYIHHEGYIKPMKITVAKTSVETGK